MPKIDEITKQQRLERLHLLLTRHPHGLTEAELADETGLERRSVNNYLRDLETQGKAYKDGLYWLPFLLKEGHLRPFDLSPEEAITLYLGARLLAKQQDKRNEPAETALLKLASVLKADAGVGDEIEQAARELAGRPVQAGYQPIFRDMVRGYIYRKKVVITYRPLNWDKPFETTFSTYLLEPSPIGFSTYLIGHSSIVNALRAYKLERIETARLTRDDYAIPPDFPGLDILRNAWSIVTGDETVRVVLNFSPQAKARVLETRWHPSQETLDDPDQPGWLLWQVDVANTLDLLPWIRGWGSDVEVLEPVGLRKALEKEVKMMAKVYGVGGISENETQFYAHSRDGVDKSEWQRLIDHLNNTAALAEKMGHDAGVAELSRVTALLHDIGKYSQAFQRRLEGAKHRVDHSTAGAKELKSLFGATPQKPLAELLAYCIAGHHAGLPDYGSVIDLGETGTLQARLNASLEDYSAYKNEIDPSSLKLPERLAIRPLKQHMGFSLAFLTRMVYSTLVDADFQETETYMSGVKPRGGYASIETLCETFNQFLRKFDNPQGEINVRRTETLKACIAKASEKPGFFTLTVPTGGGKTLASMAFALNHAAKHELKRIIYVIPFTSIIEQNAAVFKSCLGEENVLEHHSNFDWEQKRKAESEIPDNRTNSAYAKLKLAAENWDIPIVVTTNVQFFESLFANRSSRCRKLHNIAKSVIIFDEAQMLPREYLYPTMNAVWELVTNYGASAVFCTATQPALQKFFPEGTQFTELAPDPQGLFNFYRRVQVTSRGSLPDAALLDEMNAQAQTLCIVNTRKHAKGLFDGLTDEGRFHLSTLMCPAHRKQTLLDIRAKLGAGQPCRVVSTQVMEAGIDVDFPVGYRSLAGLDSIIQAAGRVNREGKLARGDMFVFEPDSEFVKRAPAYIEQGAAVARSTLRDFSADPVSIAAINTYFEQLYSLQDRNAFDAKQILACFDKADGFDFKTAAERFQIIEKNMQAVIIRFDEEAGRLIEELKYTPYPASTLRKLQPYTINIYEQEFQALNSKGAIEMVADVYAALNTMSCYHPQTGLVIPESDGGDALFF